MDKSKILTIVASVIGVIGIILLIRVMMADGNDAMDSAVGAFVSFAYWLLILAAIITVVLSLLNLIKHPQALKKSLMSIAVLGVLLVIAYFTASGDAVTDTFGNTIKDGEAGAVSKWVSALINFTGILGIIGIGLVGAGFVKSLIK